MELTSVKDRPYRSNAFAPYRPSNLSRIDSPNPPFSPPQRSATLSIIPPSPEAISQDSAFPFFPTTRSRHATLKTLSESTGAAGFDRRKLQPQQDTFGVFAPLSPKRLGGDDVMQRLDALSPGPFDTQKGRGHKKNPASASSMEDFIRSPNSGNLKRHSPYPSDTSAGDRRDLSELSTTSTLRRKGSVDRPKPRMPGSLASTGRSESADPYTREPLPVTTKYEQPAPSLAQIGRSQTSPIGSGRPGGYESMDATFREAASERSQEKPSSHRPKPSVAAAIRPLDEIGSMSSFKPSRSLRGCKESAPVEQAESLLVGRTEARNDERYQNAPPVPKPNRALDFGIGNSHHFSTESNSSFDSSGSDVRTASSRSSPPLTESPQRPKKKADTSRLDNLMNDFQLDLDSPPVLEQPVPSRRGPPPSFSRPLHSRPIEPLRDRDPVKEPPIESLNPAIQDYRRPSHDEFPAPYSLQQDTLHGSPAPEPAPSQAPLPLARKPTPVNKGSCRGCGELIFGKSVSSADGRLTGRYHKSCFVCKTCKEPFQTTDFYVISNHPYCARHYHQLNHSLCTTCDRGIEGQYLETEVKQKYHPDCFTCQVGLDTAANALVVVCANMFA